MTGDSEKRIALDALLDDMHHWAREHDPEVVRRRSDAIDVDAKLFIVGEECAKDQVRKTGVSWMRRDGSLGPAGKNLDGLLNLVGYTVCLPSAESRYRTVYTTDLVPCYPHPDGKLRPALVKAAVAKNFLQREIALLRPRMRPTGHCGAAALRPDGKRLPARLEDDLQGMVCHIFAIGRQV